MSQHVATTSTTTQGVDAHATARVVAANDSTDQTSQWRFREFVDPAADGLASTLVLDDDDDNDFDIANDPTSNLGAGSVPAALPAALLAASFAFAEEDEDLDDGDESPNAVDTPPTVRSPPPASIDHAPQAPSIVSASTSNPHLHQQQHQQPQQPLPAAQQPSSQQQRPQQRPPQRPQQSPMQRPPPQQHQQQQGPPPPPPNADASRPQTPTQQPAFPVRAIASFQNASRPASWHPAPNRVRLSDTGFAGHVSDVGPPQHNVTSKDRSGHHAAASFSAQPGFMDLSAPQDLHRTSSQGSMPLPSNQRHDNTTGPNFDGGIAVNDTFQKQYDAPPPPPQQQQHQQPQQSSFPPSHQQKSYQNNVFSDSTSGPQVQSIPQQGAMYSQQLDMSSSHPPTFDSQNPQQYQQQYDQQQFSAPNNPQQQQPESSMYDPQAGPPRGPLQKQHTMSQIPPPPMASQQPGGPQMSGAPPMMDIQHNRLSSSDTSFSGFSPDASPINAPPMSGPPVVGGGTIPRHSRSLSQSSLRKSQRQNSPGLQQPNQVSKRSSIDPLGRCEGHCVATFGFGGILVISKTRRHQRYQQSVGGLVEKAAPDTLTITNVSEFCRPSSLAKFRDAKGPLLGRKKLKKKDVLAIVDTYIDESKRAFQIAKDEHSNAVKGVIGVHSAFDTTEDVDEPLSPEVEGKFDDWIMLKLIKLALEHDGNLQEDPNLVKEFTSILDPRDIDSTGDTGRIYSALLRGDKETACSTAEAASMWPHALVIASAIGQERYLQVLLKFSKQEFSDQSDDSIVQKRSILKPGSKYSSLQLLYALFGGSGSAAVDEFMPWNMLADVATSQVELLKWRNLVTMILNNRTVDDMEALVYLADRLNVSGKVGAATFCYLLASIPSVVSGIGDPDSRLVYLGTSHVMNPDFYRDIRSFHLTEIWEFACSLRSNSDLALTLPYLQAYKLYYAGLLADHGLVSEAHAYLESIDAIVKNYPQSTPFFHIIFAEQFQNIMFLTSSLLKVSSKTTTESTEKSKGWLGRIGKIGAIGLDKLMNSAVGDIPADKTGQTVSGVNTSSDVNFYRPLLYVDPTPQNVGDGPSPIPNAASRMSGMFVEETVTVSEQFVGVGGGFVSGDNGQFNQEHSIGYGNENEEPSVMITGAEMAVAVFGSSSSGTPSEQNGYVPDNSKMEKSSEYQSHSLPPSQQQSQVHSAVHTPSGPHRMHSKRPSQEGYFGPDHAQCTAHRNVDNTHSPYGNAPPTSSIPSTQVNGMEYSQQLQPNQGDNSLNGLNGNGMLHAGSVPPVNITNGSETWPHGTASQPYNGYQNQLPHQKSPTPSNMSTSKPGYSPPKSAEIHRAPPSNLRKEFLPNETGSPSSNRTPTGQFAQQQQPSQQTPQPPPPQQQHPNQNQVNMTLGSIPSPQGSSLENSAHPSPQPEHPPSQQQHLQQPQGSRPPLSHRPNVQPPQQQLPEQHQRGPSGQLQRGPNSQSVGPPSTSSSGKPSPPRGPSNMIPQGGPGPRPRPPQQQRPSPQPCPPSQHTDGSGTHSRDSSNERPPSGPNRPRPRPQFGTPSPPGVRPRPGFRPQGGPIPRPQFTAGAPHGHLPLRPQTGGRSPPNGNGPMINGRQSPPGPRPGMRPTGLNPGISKSLGPAAGRLVSAMNGSGTNDQMGKIPGYPPQGRLAPRPNNSIPQSGPQMGPNQSRPQQQQQQQQRAPQGKPLFMNPSKVTNDAGNPFLVQGSVPTFGIPTAGLDGPQFVDSTKLASPIDLSQQNTSGPKFGGGHSSPNDVEDLGLGNSSSQQDKGGATMEESKADANTAGNSYSNENNNGGESAATKQGHNKTNSEDQDASNRSSIFSIFGNIFHKKEKSEGNAPIKANLGESSQFYYDPEKKRWVNRNAPKEEVAKKDESLAPPPIGANGLMSGPDKGPTESPPIAGTMSLGRSASSRRGARKYVDITKIN